MADTDRIIYRNLWQIGDLGTVTSEHPQFPAVDLETDTLSQFWRSRYGSGSGNGLFIIAASAENLYIDFDEGGGELTATLTQDWYNGQTLAAEIKVRMDAAGGQVYTVTYSESAAKFTISATGNFTLRWKTGTHGSDGTDTHAGTTLGFDDTANNGPGTTFTSDNRRIHWPYEDLYRDLLTAYQYNFIAILNHNLSSSAVITLYGADDAAFTVNVVSDVITYNANNIYFFLSAARTKRYLVFRIKDPENLNSYIQVATIYLGNYWEPSRKHGSEYGYGMDEISEGEESDSRAYYGVASKPRLKTYFFDYQNIDAASRANALDLMDECGIQKAFVFCEDYATPNSYSYYVQNLELFEARGTIKDRCNWALSVKEVV